ncbi:hypothetical protein ACN2MM_08705 [Alkalilimnicola ehrlichii MLHE-1]|uniref:Transmembrane protein n=1 Tax=Alkalilimnicola ehrlichii (strain ATCC BAA-1101 / DSM 17681 / MLHE-1) TaxID=187272 RepID=Q0A894_ALKEH|nr:hypothetical protein [Alkalilimnicola ehrlichii]ABI56943.1 hypothetical protein Mlg_1596 [Alkalilimnicola ehrlichii MLHE-1]
MGALGPRQVEPDAWQGWVGQAAELIRRRPLAWLAWTAAVVLLHFVSQQATWGVLRTLGTLALAPLSLLLFIRLALVADFSKPARGGLVLPGNRDCLIALAMAAILSALHGTALLALQPAVVGFEQLVEQAGYWSPRLDTGEPAAPPLSHAFMGPMYIFGALLGLAGGVLLVMLLALGQWFLLPMLVLHNAPVYPAAVVSSQAYTINPVPMMGLAGVLLVAVALVPFSLGWAGVLVAPAAGALMYVSYRDVFLGVEANRPASVVEERGGQETAAPGST